MQRSVRKYATGCKPHATSAPEDEHRNMPDNHATQNLRGLNVHAGALLITDPPPATFLANGSEPPGNHGDVGRGGTLGAAALARQARLTGHVSIAETHIKPSTKTKKKKEKRTRGVMDAADAPAASRVTRPSPVAFFPRPPGARTTVSGCPALGTRPETRAAQRSHSAGWPCNHSAPESRMLHSRAT